MLEVDFLRVPKQFSQTMVYRYRTGILCPQVKQALRRIATSEGRDFGVIGARDPNCYGGASLFDTFFVCEWPASGKGRLSETEIDRKLEVLSEGSGGRTAQFIPVTVATESLRWPAVQEACFVIEEPDITNENLVPILRFLDHSTNLLDQPHLVEQPGFVDSFKDLIDRPGTDLTSVIHLYTKLVLICTDMVTKKFDPRSARLEQLVEYGLTSPSGRLVKFIAQPDARNLISFVEALSLRSGKEGWTSKEVYQELCRITQRLLSSSSRLPVEGSSVHTGRGTGAVRGPDFVDVTLWTALLLASEDRLFRSAKLKISFCRGPNVMFFAIDQLCRDYQQRVNQSAAEEDALWDHWGALNSSLGKAAFEHEGGIAESRAKLVCALVVAGKEQKKRAPSWWWEQVLLIAESSHIEAARLRTERDAEEEQIAKQSLKEAASRKAELEMMRLVARS